MASERQFASFDENDRIGVSAFSSFLIHLVVILGIGFTIPKLLPRDHLQALEITLVHTKSKDAPKKADFLAQHNQDGGGQDKRSGIISSPIPVTEISDKDYRTINMPPPQKATSRKDEKTDLITQKKASNKVYIPVITPEKKSEQTTPASASLMTDNNTQLERKRLNSEIDRFWKNYQKKPRVKYLTARTREYRYAMYESAWAAKVERIGNINYPEGARRRKLSGYLRLGIAINADGTIHSRKILKSSGNKLLDDAALRIVQIAAPYAPFPANIRTNYDVLYIVRTWRFNEGVVREIK
ncbi:MAG: energy transducer TonB [Gammaproteobacteria bacterium]|nr:MAG: energy transducer TonB [Gammaproteobacteria bacterium]